MFYFACACFSSGESWVRQDGIGREQSRGKDRAGQTDGTGKCEEVHQPETRSSRMRRARRLLDTLRLYDDGTRKKTRPSNSTIISLTSILKPHRLGMQENSMVESKRRDRRPLPAYRAHLITSHIPFHSNPLPQQTIKHSPLTPRPGSSLPIIP